MVGEARWIGQPSTGYSETGFVLEAGYYLTPNLRLAGGYMFGNVADDGFSGSRSSSGPFVGLTVKLNELFDGFGLQKITPPQQQESQTISLAKRLNQADNAKPCVRACAIALWNRNDDVLTDEIDFSGKETNLDLQINQLASRVKQLLTSYLEVNSSQPLAITLHQASVASVTQVQGLDKPTLPTLLRGEKL